MVFSMSPSDFNLVFELTLVFIQADLRAHITHCVAHCMPRHGHTPVKTSHQTHACTRVTHKFYRMLPQDWQCGKWRLLAEDMQAAMPGQGFQKHQRPEYGPVALGKLHKTGTRHHAGNAHAKLQAIQTRSILTGRHGPLLKGILTSFGMLQQSIRSYCTWSARRQVRRTGARRPPWP